MSIQSWEPAAPTTTLDRPPAQERRSIVKPSRGKQYEPIVIGTFSVILALTAWQLVANARVMPILQVHQQGLTVHVHLSREERRAIEVVAREIGRELPALPAPEE